MNSLGFEVGRLQFCKSVKVAERPEVLSNVTSLEWATEETDELMSLNITETDPPHGRGLQFHS